MDRVFSFSSCLAAVLMLTFPLRAQEFSSDPDYVKFYETRHDPPRCAENTVAFWWITEQFGNRDVSRDQLREILARYIKMYSDSYRTRARSHLRILQRMARETRPPDDRKIEQLIFDLRDLNYVQCFEPNSGLAIVGPPHPLKYEDGTPLPKEKIEWVRSFDDAADHLRDIGYDCIPALIEHLDDDTLTRSVNYGMSHAFSHRVLTVGECCRQILDQILPSGRIIPRNDDPKEWKRVMKNHYRHLVTQANKRAEP